MWTAGVIYISRVAPPGLGASAQSAFGATFMGLGRAAGALLGARIYAGLGSDPLYQIAAGVSLIGVIIYSTVSWRMRRHDRQQVILRGG